MSDIISQLPNEILRIIMENVGYSPNLSPFVSASSPVTSIRDLKSATEVSKRIRSVCLPIFWQSVEIRPKGISHYTDLPGLPLLYLSPVSSKYIKHLHFRNSLEGCWRFYQCPHSNGPRKADLVVYDLDDDDLYDLDNGDSKDDGLDCLDGVDWGTHSRRFDHLSFASEIVVNGLSHRQLRSFSWDLGTCIPETILGPSGIITLRQDSIENISLTTDRRCFLDDDSTITWCPHPYNQGSTIHLDNFKNLKSFRWRGPRCEDIDTLSSAIKNNRTNLIKLELDFVGWDDQHGDWFPSTEQSNECPLLTQILDTAPYPPSPIFLKLQELSISYAPIGPAFASALDIRSLVSLKLHYCSGWTKLVEKVTESSITLKLKTFEICDYEFNDRSEWQKAITDLLGSFGGLEKLHVFLGPPGLTSWIPTRDNLGWEPLNSIQHKSTHINILPSSQ
ncbi:hypothetical protein HZ326_25051 [Fusarium oxysporum f. sp. albedinis]|nr:Uncharacterized protein HZ326_27789 [Fusarium oxysporum f. sp. albedinis]KAJ0131852.1 hypothetical protein HZ326_25051 [Fusarium oxysporum f. sp. albedinis]KAK2470384.1 hypothetical protein H9L39_18001 [Fusarium oxysporum f. sp. albedinis]